MSLYAIRNDEGLLMDDLGQFEHNRDICAFHSKSDAKDWADNKRGHVVELAEVPAKVVVNQEEEYLLKELQNGGYLASDEISYFSENHTDDELDQIALQDRLMRAYVIGWTVEKPKRWNVKVPHATNSYYYDMGWGNGLETQDMKTGTQPLPGFREAQFTQDEINKRGLQDCEKVEVTDDEQ